MNRYLKRDEIFKIILLGTCLLFILLISWYQQEISTGYNNFVQCFDMEIRYIILNILTNTVIWFFVFIVINRIWLSSLIFSGGSFIISIVNYYMVKLSGRPLSIMELKNAKTAMNVIQAYKLELDCFSVIIIASFIICLLLCFVIKKLEIIREETVKKRLIKSFVICLAGILFFHMGYFAENSIKPQKTVGWSWVEAYHKYGYMACSIEMIYQTRNIVNIPEGYTLEKVSEVNIPRSDDKNEMPDIILILNESFYDLSIITDLETDVQVLENINTLENCLKGYTVVPSAGGGTNSSEYELLTSNSLQLMKGITPFNVLDMSESNSIVSHLNTLGYDTTGAHSEPALNYSRGRAYSDMGFDYVYFDDDFSEKEYYENRWFETDESLYKNLISWYEQDLGYTPKFMYLLTIQNHGGWDLNEKDKDQVHALKDYGEYDEEIDEYLTCLYQSDLAFKNLTDYFKKVERPVIVCMVGDHSPTFAEKIVDEKYTSSEKRRLLRSTPFVIWANYDIGDAYLGDISLNYLVPKVLDIAGVKISPYYAYQIDLMKKIPILASYDKYFDIEGNEYSYDDNNMYTELVNGYFYLEYNNLHKERVQSLFEPYKE